MRNFLKFLIFAVIVHFLSSCTPQKKLLLLQGQMNEYISQPLNVNDYIIQNGDFLTISVKSVNENASKLFSVSDSKTGAYNSDITAFFNSFPVNDSGFIRLPLVGNIKVSGITVPQANFEIERKIKEYFFDAVVDTKILGFKFTVLGEVNKPGTFRVFDSKLTILEAIGFAGDLTVFGKRDILMLRQIENGYKIFNINLKDRDILTKEYFFIQPNDIIYVEPHKAKSFGFAKFPISEILSIITTTIVVVSFLTK